MKNNKFSVPQNLSALAKRLRPTKALGPSEKSPNQGINWTLIQLGVGASAQWLRPSMSFVGCIKASYAIR